MGSTAHLVGTGDSRGQLRFGIMIGSQGPPPSTKPVLRFRDLRGTAYHDSGISGSVGGVSGFGHSTPRKVILRVWMNALHGKMLQ